MTAGRPRAPRFKGFCECGDHAWAHLTRGFVTLVSPEDAGLLQETAWTATARAYVCRDLRPGEQERRKELLHRAIVQPSIGVIVDHANGNGLDNRRGNLRESDYSLNAANSRASRWRDLPKGVNRNGSGFSASIRRRGTTHYLGTFSTPDAAHEAYVAKARELFGEFARPA